MNVKDPHKQINPSDDARLVATMLRGLLYGDPSEDLGDRTPTGFEALCMAIGGQGKPGIEAHTLCGAIDSVSTALESLGGLQSIAVVLKELSDVEEQKVVAHNRIADAFERLATVAERYMRENA